jgi:ComEC/Rec2-related protein
MRRSGLTHLLSVSGLHIAAAVGAAMLLTLKLLALSERLALRFNLILVAAGVGALTGIAYTLLTGAQVPTVRSCIAALLVLAGIALGRDAISIRLLAVGALLVMLFRPEALAGASFQLSFAAVASHRASFERLGAADVRPPRRRDSRANRPGAVGHGRHRPGGRARADPVRALPFSQSGALRRRGQHHRHPADDVRHHAARGGRAAA